MKEDFLHYMWRFQKMGHLPLETATGAPIRVINPGLPNSGGGPDFTNAKMWIGETLWAGAVELHLSASSWYHHSHHLDKSYDAVILHVVWENDAEVCYPSGRLIPCLELSKRIAPQRWRLTSKTFTRSPIGFLVKSILIVIPIFNGSIGRNAFTLNDWNKKHNLFLGF